MNTSNVGTADRIIRVVIGVAMLLIFLLYPDLPGWRWLLLIGIVPLVTGAAGICPLYRALGISTNREG